MSPRKEPTVVYRITGRPQPMAQREPIASGLETREDCAQCVAAAIAQGWRSIEIETIRNEAAE